jgi:hypothetical protein
MGIFGHFGGGTAHKLGSAALLAIIVSGQAIAAETPIPIVDSEYSRALTCLTQAVSYEAGQEDVEGQEAVAQVVLNRVRHPAFPSTVCGVVYQGSERKTGCQFTFTCDGSLTRRRSAASLLRSQIVAERVLAGQASTLVGGATHYHANYVSPYWAPSLVKVAQIGAHIFYRMPGAPDTPAIVAAGSLKGEPQIAFGKDTAPLRHTPTQVAATSATFSPWGLPVLTVSRNGDVRQVGN